MHRTKKDNEMLQECSMLSEKYIFYDGKFNKGIFQPFHQLNGT